MLTPWQRCRQSNKYMENMPLAQVEKAQAAINCDKPSMPQCIFLPPGDQLGQAIEAALAAFEVGFVLTRRQPEAHNDAQHDATCTRYDLIF